MFAIVPNLYLLTLYLYTSTASNVSDQYYPYYHLAPEFGWMNDPNGFCMFRHEYHLFYQYNPESSQEPGIAHWAHAKSPDLFNWEHLPIAMYPDQSYDINGVFSGSALIEHGKMYLFYTGNVNHPGENPDHTQRQALAYSDDGVTVTKYPGNPIIIAEEYQPNIRDPKVWKHGDTYYMVLGNSFDNNTRGRVLLYTSEDKISWQEVSVLAESDGFLGYMWECPDFFELGGKWVLLFSPQGIEPEGDKYKNLYQTGYIIGDFDYDTNKFCNVTQFKELDHGHDFYATQTILDPFERRIVVAWFDMWEQDYPERNDGFTGQLTIPRVLELTEDLRLIQRPVEGIYGVRDNTLYFGKGSPETVVKLINNTGEIKITTSKKRNFEVTLEADDTSLTISYNSTTHRVTLNRGGNDGMRRTQWEPKGKLEIRIFVDRSSVEVFCGKGEVTFSSRFFPDDFIKVKLKTKVDHMTVFSMKRTIPKP